MLVWASKFVGVGGIVLTSAAIHAAATAATIATLSLLMDYVTELGKALCVQNPKLRRGFGVFGGLGH